MGNKQICKISFMVVALVTIFLSTEVGLALPKSSPAFLLNEAKGIIWEENYTNAQAAIEKLLANYPDHPDIVKVMGDIAYSYRGKKEYDRAIELYQHILSKYPSHNRAIWIQSGLAKSYLLQNENTKADAAVKKLLSNYSDHPDIVNVIVNLAGYCYKYKRTTDRAMELYQYILSNYPLHDWVRQSRSNNSVIEAYADLANGNRNNNPDKAIELYQYVLKHFSDHRWTWKYKVEALNHLTRIYMKKGDHSKAQDAFGQLLANYSSSPRFLKAVNEVLRRSFLILNEDQAKKYIFDKFFDGEKSVQIQKAGVLYCIKYFDRETVLEAFNGIGPKLSKNPDSLIIVSEIADSCHELQKDEIAIKIYQIYLNDYAIEADKEKIKLKLYESMYAVRVDPEKILTSLEEYVGRNKATDVELTTKAIAFRGRIFANIGEIDKAINEFLLIKNKYPKSKESPEASYFVGYCYMLQSKFDEAKEYFNQVAKDYPESSYASKSKVYVKRIESMVD